MWDTRRLGKQPPVLFSRDLGVDHHLFTTFKNKDDGFLSASLRVEAEAQILMGLLIETKPLLGERPARIPVLERAGVDPQAAN